MLVKPSQIMKKGKVGNVHTKSTTIDSNEDSISVLTKQVALLMSAMNEHKSNKKIF